MEILYYKLTGNASEVTATMTLANNVSRTSFYYGYTGSGGTYYIPSTCGALGTPMIIDRTSTNFGFYVTKSTGVVMMLMLVVYDIASSDYPAFFASSR